jgi:hypothetical protein
MDFKEIEQKFLKAPTDIKRALTSSELGDQIVRIAQQHDLEGEGVNLLSDEIALTLLRVKSKETLPERLQQTLSLTAEKSASLVTQIDKEILSNLLESSTPHVNEVVTEAPDKKGEVPRTLLEGSPRYEQPVTASTQTPTDQEEKSHLAEPDPYREPAE